MTLTLARSHSTKLSYYSKYISKLSIVLNKIHSLGLIEFAVKQTFKFLSFACICIVYLIAKVSKLFWLKINELLFIVRDLLG